MYQPDRNYKRFIVTDIKKVAEYELEHVKLTETCILAFI